MRYSIKISLCLLVAIVSTSTYAQQVMIGNKASFSSSSSIMEFPENDTRGMVLPILDIANMTPNYVGGTIVLDSKSKKVKYYADNNQWIELSPNDGDLSKVIISTQQEKEGMRTLIGNNSNITTIGALVLDSTDKALVLPRVDSPHLTMIDPPAGTLVFDTKTKMLCVYNGKEWTFWEVEK